MIGLYRFEAEDGLDLVPLAARRSLDAAGAKLSLEGWRSLPLSTREALVEAGAGDHVEAPRVRRLVSSATPPAKDVEPLADPPVAAPPDHVRTALADAESLWSRLSPLDRYVLAKLAERDRAGRLGTAFEEIRARLV